MSLIIRIDGKPFNINNAALQNAIKQLQAELAMAKEEIKRLKGTCMCMDCGKTIRTVEQSNHDKTCKVALKGDKP